MTPVEHNFPRNMTEQNSLLLSFPTHSWILNRNGAPQNKKLTVYITVTKWNYYLQGAEIIVRNDHKPLARFLNGKNANNKVNRWGLELATYNITFEWISGACKKAADCLSHLVELPQNEPTTISMLSATHSDRLAFNSRSRTAQQSLSEDTTPQTDTVSPDVTDTQSTPPKSLPADRLEALLQIQKVDPFCKCISK